MSIENENDNDKNLNNMKKHFLYSSPGLMMVLASTVVMLTFCKSEQTLDDVHILMTLVSNKDAPLTKATVDNVWSGGEQPWVSIDNGTAVAFTALQSGTLVPLIPLYWQDESQNITARAWHPDSWTFPIDQSAGLQPADFIFASTVTGITASNYSEKPLVFQHRTAKITVNLTAGTDINHLSNAAVTFYGYASGNPNTNDTGNGVIAGSGNGWIIPQNTNGNTYAALLIPRDMTGIPFIKITIGGNDFFYTPTAGQAALQQGMSYVYNITVYMTRIEVEVANGIVWTDGNEYNITPSA